MSLNRTSMPSLLRKKGGRMLAGSETHGSLQTEPSFRKLRAKRSETEEGMPQEYGKGRPGRARKFTKAPKTDDYFHEPKEFGPNHQHTLAGKDHFAEGGHAKGGKWIQGAIKHPGALHNTLHVPRGRKIPLGKLEKAEHSNNPLTRKRANLAMTLRGFHHKGPRGG